MLNRSVVELGGFLCLNIMSANFRATEVFSFAQTTASSLSMVEFPHQNPFQVAFSQKFETNIVLLKPFAVKFHNEQRPFYDVSASKQHLSFHHSALCRMYSV
jgi:hypothetical protein